MHHDKAVFIDALYLWADTWLQEHTNFTARERARIALKLTQSAFAEWGAVDLARMLDDPARHD